MNKKKWSSLEGKRLRSIVWIVYIVLLVLIFYVNWFMPHGEFIPTGYDDDEGREIYVEDVRELNIPNWAKFLRTHARDVYIMGFFVAIVVAEVLIKPNSEGV
jgi:hypothetical protein